MHDCVASCPSVSLAGCPWIRVVSANPLEVTDPDIPPVFSGYPTRDRRGWDEFWVEYRRLTDPLVERASAFHQPCGAPPLPDGEFQYESPYLNLYMYPAELDYQRSRPLGSTWFWDQYDNAQRIDECGYGVRLSTYEFTDDELHGTINWLGNDQQLTKRLAAASKRLQALPGRVLAADLIDKLIRS